MNFFGESLNFTQPWLLLLLLLLPLLAFLAGARGHAPAVTFSSLAPLRASLIGSTAIFGTDSSGWLAHARASGRFDDDHGPILGRGQPGIG